MIELALPAGTLENAIVAFEHGADAVYFGLKDFSARKNAGNFSFEDLSKIRRYSIEKKKKTYITINTLVDDKSLEKLYDTLERITEYGTDGIICQDLGAIRLIRRDFSSLPLHASTQLAVHTIDGVKALEDLGFERVVLSRELNLKEIEKIRNACPDIELKVFIHGAMCYGFSGLCMASFLKTGRSANEGSCAQVCRTWFEDLKSKEKLYPFSLKDLEAGELVKELERIKIDSLKIEGRLKGNEYVAATASYYRAIIDGKDPKPLHSAVKTSFQRISSTGYFNYTGPGHENLNTGLYTGHIGEEIGKVVQAKKKSIEVNELKRINQYDGLMLLSKNKNGLIDSYKFSAHITRKEREKAILSLDESTNAKPGDILYRISNSTLNIKSPSLALAHYKTPLDIDIKIYDNKIVVNGEAYNIAMQKGEKDGYEDAIKRIFLQAGDAPFSPATIKIENKSSYEYPFLRPSDLKKIRRDAYEKIKPNHIPIKGYKIAIPKSKMSITLPPREKLESDAFPFGPYAVDVDGICYIIMPPVSYSEEEMLKSVLNEAKKHKKVRIGMNNISNLRFAKEHPEYEYFADVYLYMSNREAASLVFESIPNFIGCYLWLERKEYQKPWPIEPTIVDKFSPPLFISRSCYRHDSLNLDCKGCSREHRFEIEQNGKQYTVVVHNCQTAVSDVKHK